ncbi:long-chain base protein 3 [Pyricularia oryzae Y34]|uniref:Long-chain base protein 3 n=1 Tax=Pyricularia oryzae (strain Y34) TaxID=1143189 RepID=A0AA97NUC9_PYRO3|nr:long-chain base protein 3 [Pyricularia oryzae Y34]
MQLYDCEEAKLNLLINVSPVTKGFRTKTALALGCNMQKITGMRADWCIGYQGLFDSMLPLKQGARPPSRVQQVLRSFKVHSGRDQGTPISSGETPLAPRAQNVLSTANRTTAHRDEIDVADNAMKRNNRGSSPASASLPKIAVNGPSTNMTAEPDKAGTEGERVQGGGDGIDAGLRSLGHYKRALPPWRYAVRQKMLPLIRWETPYLAWLQSKIRSPALDSYFAITANLGTHTFFMIGLPIMFWCGFMEFGKGLVHILATGVFVTGFIKDLLSLPRPLSPPLHRITMSGSAALEYGFPSTHSTNAVSVAVLGILMLHDPTNTLSSSVKLYLEVLSYFYAVSIVFGRLYCGMHGFLDVIIGSLIGIFIALGEFYCGPILDSWLHATGWRGSIVFILTIIVLVRIHPEPADDCPCFDDSVAFAGVMMGLEVGFWHYMHSSFAWPASDRFSLSQLGWPTVGARLVAGIIVIFAWREIMKPALLKILPYIFRAIEDRGLSLPRRFFVNASEYKNIPDLLRLHTDNVIPSVSDLPEIVRNIRRVGTRGRSVSIGPQSAADAYETLAYRERRRRESMGSNASLGSKPSLRNLREEVSREGGASGDAFEDGDGFAFSSSLSSAQQIRRRNQSPGTLADYESQMGRGTVVVGDEGGKGEDDVDIFIGQQDEFEEKEMFEKLIKPRVRYDVEVVTKLVVYAGIAWLSVEGIPVMFEYIGLGAEHLRQPR